MTITLERLRELARGWRNLPESTAEGTAIDELLAIRELAARGLEEPEAVAEAFWREYNERTGTPFLLNWPGTERIAAVLRKRDEVHAAHAAAWLAEREGLVAEVARLRGPVLSPGARCQDGHACFCGVDRREHWDFSKPVLASPVACGKFKCSDEICCNERERALLANQAAAHAETLRERDAHIATLEAANAGLAEAAAEADAETTEATRPWPGSTAIAASAQAIRAEERERCARAMDAIYFAYSAEVIRDLKDPPSGSPAGPVDDGKTPCWCGAARMRPEVYALSLGDGGLVHGHTKCPPYESPAAQPAPAEAEVAAQSVGGKLNTPEGWPHGGLLPPQAEVAAPVVAPALHLCVHSENGHNMRAACGVELDSWTSPSNWTMKEEETGCPTCVPHALKELARSRDQGWAACAEKRAALKECQAKAAGPPQAEGTAGGKPDAPAALEWRDSAVGDPSEGCGGEESTAQIGNVELVVWDLGDNEPYVQIGVKVAATKATAESLAPLKAEAERIARAAGLLGPQPSALRADQREALAWVCRRVGYLRQAEGHLAVLAPLLEGNGPAAQGGKNA